MAQEKLTYLDLLPLPGETIIEIMENKGITQVQLSAKTGFTKKHINEVIKGKKKISSDFAIAIANALDTDPHFLLNLQATYDIEKDKIESQYHFDETDKKLANKFSYDQLREYGYIPNDSDDTLSGKILALKKFFGVSSLGNVLPALLQKEPCFAFKKSESVQTDPYTLATWLQMCLKEDDTNCPDFNKSALKKNLPEIRKQILVQDINKGLNNLTKILYSCGVSFHVIHNLKGAPVQGYITLKNRHVLMCITLRQKFSDIFWFTIFHELGHLLSESPTKEGRVDYINNMNIASEQQANQFAEKQLIPQKDFETFQHTVITENSIRAFAKKMQITPEIVVGRLGHIQNDYFKKFAHLRTKIDWA